VDHDDMNVWQVADPDGNMRAEPECNDLIEETE
jgi:hypothetical protein